MTKKITKNLDSMKKLPTFAPTMAPLPKNDQHMIVAKTSEFITYIENVLVKMKRSRKKAELYVFPCEKNNGLSTVAMEGIIDKFKSTTDQHVCIKVSVQYLRKLKSYLKLMDEQLVCLQITDTVIIPKLKTPSPVYVDDEL